MRTEEMEQLGEEDALDPHPDIHALFCHYNSLYFADALGACSVAWSGRRMTRCAGVCHYQPSGGCEIRLSEPLLKYRPTADLKNTLLHEMIHAFLWIETQNKDHGDHGLNFQRLMNGINCSSIDDHQRPSGGYNITVYHNFHAEVENYQVYQWICESCGDLIKRAMNRRPSPNDCVGKVKQDRQCGNPYCHWHGHEMACSGRYVKVAEPPGYEGKGPKGEHKLRNDGPKESSHASTKKTVKSHKAATRDQSDVRKSKAITNFFPVVDSRNLDTDDSSSDEDSGKHLFHDSSNAVALKLPNDPAPEQISKGVRSHASGKKRKFTFASQRCNRYGNKYIIMSGWLDWYVEEEEGIDDVEPLINKRTERRKKQKMIMMNSKRKIVEDDTTADTSQTGIVELGVTKIIDAGAAGSQDSKVDRGANPSRACGFCTDSSDGLHNLSEDETTHLHHSGKVNILEISDD